MSGIPVDFTLLLLTFVFMLAFISIILAANRLLSGSHALYRVREVGGANGSIASHLLIIDLIYEGADVDSVLESLRSVASKLLISVTGQG